MARVPEVTREGLPEELREAFDQVLEANGGRVSGPTSITVNSPEMARRRGHLTSYLRYETSISQNILELAIITAARAMDCAYVWNAHAPAARRAGVSDSVIDALREKQPLPEHERAGIRHRPVRAGVLLQSQSQPSNLPDRFGPIWHPAPG